MYKDNEPVKSASKPLLGSGLVAEISVDMTRYPTKIKPKTEKLYAGSILI